MSEDTSTASASEQHQDGAGASDSGSASEGSAGTSQAGADAFASERESYEARVRAEQSRADRAEAALRAAEARKDGAKSSDGGESALTPDLMRREMQAMEARFQRREEFRAALPGLKEQFKLASASIFDSAMDFESLAELRVALEDSHKATEALVAADKAAFEEELKKQYAEKYGPLDETPTDTGSGETGGLPTAEAIAKMTFEEQDKVDERFGAGTVERILRQAMGG